jgi:hypothetical protein
MAYANGYTYRRSITTDHTKVSGTGDLTNFPVLVKGTYTYLKTTANAGKVENASGYDIVFAADGDGATPLKHETERYIATTGEIIYWVKIPTLDGDAATTFYMFYGNSSISTDQSDKNNVWRSEYKAVLHLQESGNSTAGEYKDSTANNNHGEGGADSGTNVPARVTGKIGYAQEFDDGNSEGIAIPDSATVDLSGDATISFYGRSSGSGSDTWEAIIAKRSGGSTCNYQIFLWDFSQDISWQNGGSASRGSATMTSTFKKITMVIDSTADTVGVYIDGSLHQTFTSRELGATNAAKLTLGYWSDGTPKEYFSGDLEELRLYAGKLTADWIATEHNNENSPSTFYTVGDEETSSSVQGINVWNGSAFVEKPVKVWNGSSWVQKPVKRWNGSSWV